MSAAHCRCLVWIVVAARALSASPMSNCKTAAGCFDPQESEALQLMQTKLELRSGAPKTIYDKHGVSVENTSDAAGIDQEFWPVSLKVCLVIGCATLAIATAMPHIQGKAKEAANVGFEKSELHGRKLFKAVDALRLVAAIHIVFFHFGPPWSAHFNQWGASWLSFFFALSGLGPAWSKNQKGDHVDRVLPHWRTIWRRWARLYPLYVFALLSCTIQHVIASSHGIEWRPFLRELFMVPVANQRLDDWSYHYNGVDWFCTILVLCWLFEEVFFLLVGACWRRGVSIQVMMVCFCGIAWAALTPNARTVVQIQSDHDLGGEILLGLSWIFCYFCGVVTAFIISGQSIAPNPLSQISASTAAAMILATFVTTNLQLNEDPRDNHHSRLILLPLQCLLIYGLSMEHDPLAKLLALVPSWLSELSFEMYMLQGLVRNLLSAHSVSQFLGKRCETGGKCDHTVAMWALLPTLLLVAALANRFVVKPCSCMLNRLF